MMKFWVRIVVGLSFFLVTCIYFAAQLTSNSHSHPHRRNLYRITRSFCTFSPRKNPQLTTEVDYVKMSQTIHDCVCSRTFMYPPKLSKGGDHERDADGSETYPRLNSSCSDEGTHYQSGQNVISMSLWHDPLVSPALLRNYQEGIYANLQMMRHYHPNYSLRIYTNVSLNGNDESGYCDLLCNNKDFFWCDITNTPSHGDMSLMVSLTWRFLVLGDPTVNIFHSRDLDSLISYREAAVERDWLAKDDHKAIMLMRDNKEFHQFLPILGGMWGADNTKLTNLSIGDNLRTNIIQLSKELKYHVYSGDQTILNQVIFYNISRDIVAYDSYHCVYWSNYTKVRPFPTKRGDCADANDFVGTKVNYTGKYMYWLWGANQMCPFECRPKYGLHWTYC